MTIAKLRLTLPPDACHTMIVILSGSEEPALSEAERDLGIVPEERCAAVPT